MSSVLEAKPILFIEPGRVATRALGVPTVYLQGAQVVHHFPQFCRPGLLAFSSIPMREWSGEHVDAVDHDGREVTTLVA